MRSHGPPAVVTAPAGGAATTLGFIDRIDASGVGGWVVDLRRPALPMVMRVLIDGVVVDAITCDLQRGDAHALQLPTTRIGFYYNIPTRYHDGLRHGLRFAATDGMVLSMATRDHAGLVDWQFCLARAHRVEGMIDGMIDGMIQGWALNVDAQGAGKCGGVRILVMSGGEPVSELIADQYRADVAAAVGCEAACGFSFVPPAAWRQRGRVAYRFLAMPDRHELPGSPVEVAYPSASERDRINGLIAQVDQLFAAAYHLRRGLAAALPRERYELGDYARWAAASLPLAAARAQARYGPLPAALPLVSVICPVYRPAIGAFLTAVDSVLAQTYPHWELLLVDDGSADAVLSQAMARLAAGDARISLSVRARNGGIAAATNAGIRQAAGQLVVFFDHDDALEACALEVMVRAQAATGALVLYSDEDKIDRDGSLSAPHLKPDFNYRLLLDVNYICHLVMVETATLRDVGALRSRYDGAQDHDLLLRLAEAVPAERVHHVAEILYHWRKTGGSSAAAGAFAKPAAAKAGAAAVAAHLARRKVAARVSSRGGLTCYKVTWMPGAAARSCVSILIPYRDHIDMTRACVTALRQVTRDVDFEIILVDNGSSEAGAEAFATAQGNIAGTQIVRVAEPFNFSRLNNLGAQRARNEFLLFLNNDVIVKEPSWLREMVDEGMAFADVGAVGAKLLYPDGAVQHAGVVLGVGGVADHAFRGLSGTAPGYVMRAMLAAQVSAVTGACMLVRRSAFNAVGGFDEAALPVAFNDVDLCMKLTQAGWRIVFNPDAVAEHRESMSRGDDRDDARVARFMHENEVMRQRHGVRLARDPWYNRHFSREGGVYRELRLLGADDS